MNQVMTERRLRQETREYRGTGGTSEEGRSLGFEPAFLDTETDLIHASCFADGRPAPFHLLDGLPHELVLARGLDDRVVTVKASVISGFVRHGRFYTRDEAASLASAEPPCLTFA